jgi:hypothetical protein
LAYLRGDHDDVSGLEVRFQLLAAALAKVFIAPRSVSQNPDSQAIVEHFVTGGHFGRELQAEWLLRQSPLACRQAATTQQQESMLSRN